MFQIDWFFATALALSLFAFAMVVTLLLSTGATGWN